MPTIGMFKEVKNTVLFHQARNEIKVGFPILHAILSGWRWGLGTVLEIGVPTIGENCPDNIRDALVLENATVRLPGKEP